MSNTSRRAGKIKPFQEKHQWKVVSNFKVNHFGLMNDEDNTNIYKELLNAYIALKMIETH